MNKEIKKDDKVWCVDNKGNEDLLSLEKVYIVSWTDGVAVEINDGSKRIGEFYLSRFEVFDNPFIDEEIITDNVNSPSHYTQGQYETIDVIEDIIEDVPSYLLGNIIKYVSRYKNKNGVQDLEKAEWYLKRLIEKEKK